MESNVPKPVPMQVNPAHLCQVTIVGVVLRTYAVRFLRNGTEICSFALGWARNRRPLRIGTDGKPHRMIGDVDAAWVLCKVFGSTATSLNKLLVPKLMVLAIGRLQRGPIRIQGKMNEEAQEWIRKHGSLYMIADRVSILNRGTTPGYVEVPVREYEAMKAIAAREKFRVPDHILKIWQVDETLPIEEDPAADVEIDATEQ